MSVLPSWLVAPRFVFLRWIWDLLRVELEAGEAVII